jgi:hypothetical protein
MAGEEVTSLPTPATHGAMSESEIDDTLAETFPASDPPSWTLGTDHRSGAAPAGDERPDGEGGDEKS